MLYPLVLRPLLFQLDAEKAHDLTLKLLGRFANFQSATKTLHAFTAAKSKPVTVAGLSFPNRVGLAGGLDKNAVAIRAWWALGFGFVELGTVTPKPQTGNPKPRMRRLPERRAILNRMGFNNDGADAVALRLKDLTKPPFPIGVSIGKQATTPVDDLGAVARDYAECAAKLSPVADFLTVNVSSPNTAGLRSLQTGSALRRIVEAAKTAKPLFVKFAPELGGTELCQVVDAALTGGATGLIATNTLAQFDANNQPMGGLSGAPLKGLAANRIETIRKHAGDEVPLIGVGGIDNGPSAKRMLDAGADLIQLYTGLVYAGPFLAARLARITRRPSMRNSPLAARRIASG
jgi:dihydroorotate dehydrogenase